jgi:hypothetical protein
MFYAGFYYVAGIFFFTAFTCTFYCSPITDRQGYQCLELFNKFIGFYLMQTATVITTVSSFFELVRYRLHKAVFLVGFFGI